MGYSVKRNPKFEARIYIGSRENYNGPPIPAAALKEAVKQFQTAEGLEKASPVRMTATTFMWQDYEEEGWELGVINYPRRPLGGVRLYDFAMKLAGYLLDRLKQNRISIEFPDETVMLEADDAESKHK